MALMAKTHSSPFDMHNSLNPTRAHMTHNMGTGCICCSQAHVHRQQHNNNIKPDTTDNGLCHDWTLPIHGHAVLPKPVQHSALSP